LWPGSAAASNIPIPILDRQDTKNTRQTEQIYVRILFVAWCPDGNLLYRIQGEQGLLDLMAAEG
jgi:hypothetical protein